MKRCDMLFVGVGGQGVLTLADLLVQAALAGGIPATYVPTKGMAQRGGFVKVEVRIGGSEGGPRVRMRGADVVCSMERSESLKGLPYLRPGGILLLYDHVWAPTGVQLGRDAYPSLEAVREAVRETGAALLALHPADRPLIEGRPVAANVYLLGALLTVDGVSGLIDADVTRSVVEAKWPKAAKANRRALDAGAAAARHTA